MRRAFREHFHSHSRPVEPLPAHEYIILLRKWGHQKTWGTLLVRSQGVHFRKYPRCNYAPALSSHTQRAAQLAAQRTGSPARDDQSQDCWLRSVAADPSPPGPTAPPGSASRIPTLGRSRAGRALATVLHVFTGRFTPARTLPPAYFC